MPSLRHRFAEVLTAHGDVALVAADFDLGAFSDCVAFGIGAQVHGGFTGTVANRFELDQVVGPAEQGGAAGKEVALEVGSQAVTEHGDAELVGDLAELLDLCACGSSFGY